MSMGADVQWLSAFPDEAEFLYPPLTYLKPTSNRHGQVLGGLRGSCGARQ